MDRSGAEVYIRRLDDHTLVVIAERVVDVLEVYGVQGEEGG